MDGHIEVVSGTLGGGKSLYAAEETYFHLWAGLEVYTNLRMHNDAIAALMRKSGRIFDPSRLHELPRDSLDDFELGLKRGTPDAQVLVVIDESALYYSARDYRKTQREMPELLDYITMVRKLDQRLILISQDFGGIDKNMRVRVQRQVFCRNFRKFRFMGLFPLPIPIMLRIFYFQDHKMKHPEKEGVEPFFNRSWVWPLYDSDAMHGKTAERFEGLEISRRIPLKKCSPDWLHVLRIRAFLSFLTSDFILCVILFLSLLR